MSLSSLKPDAPATAIGNQRTRIPALDFTKGVLVLFMVLYHWINYFIGGEWPYYRYLRFVSPAFIFISGFMISKVYLSKYDASDPRLSKRLFTRGLKLIAIFVALNAARDSLLPISSRASLAHLFDAKALLAIFITGNFTDKVVSFFILVPIAYLLILSAMMMPFVQKFKWTFHCVGILFFLSALGLSFAGEPSMHLEIMSIGIFGVILGFLPRASIDRMVSHPYLLVFAYVLYTAAITVWNVPFLLEWVGVVLTVSAIYLVGTSEGASGRIRGGVMLLGGYSLFAYIWQIVVLQVLAASLKRFNAGLPMLVVTFCAAFAFTYLGVEAVKRARDGSRNFDRVYKMVFN
jgi:peptidoglycan/LPS O-acetylase OafA/YrhL